MSLFKSTKHIEHCPQCQAPLQLKKGKQGLFLGCSNYPQCDYLKPLQHSSHIIKTLDEHCPECDALLQLKQGSFGMFIGCSRYPDCHFIVHEQAEAQVQLLCPECKKYHLVERMGRSGKHFYGCSGYPECKFTLPRKPVLQACPQCGCQLAVHKRLRGKDYFICADKHCQHQFTLISEVE